MASSVAPRWRIGMPVAGGRVRRLEPVVSEGGDNRLCAPSRSRRGLARHTAGAPVTRSRWVILDAMRVP